MDSIDRQIITILQKNARSSISEISAKVNLSIPATSDRIRKIETAGSHNNNNDDTLHT